MTEVVDFEVARRRVRKTATKIAPRRPIFFDRNELGQILSVYSRKVIAGEWIDYAIEIDSSGASFMIFCRTPGNPAYRIIKHPIGPNAGWYQVTSGGYILGCGKSLCKVLKLFRHTPFKAIEAT